jgi:hypothetical protein
MENEKMAINIDELNQWIETDGKQWADNLKSGLVNKRDELLAALKDSNAKLAELEQRSTAAASELDQERAALNHLVVDRELSRILKSKNVFESAVPSVIAELKDSYGIAVKADGLNRQAIGKTKGEDGAETELNLETIVSNWSGTPAAKLITISGNNGGGALGSWGNTTSSATLRTDGPALAKMSDAEFRAARDQAIHAKDN